MSPKFQVSALVAVIATSVLTACSDAPRNPSDVASQKPADVVRPQAYSAAHLAELSAGFEDVHVRIVSSISGETTFATARAIMAALETEITSNDLERVRSALLKAHKELGTLAATEEASEHRADLEAVKLVLHQAFVLLPGVDATQLEIER